MSRLPEKLIESLEDAAGFNKESFIRVHERTGQVTAIRVNPSKPAILFEDRSTIPWTEYGYYLPSRPFFTFDPFLHGGLYYVQEASSMFLEQCLRQLVDLQKEIRVLDLCAAPGGKSTHIQSLLNEKSLLVSNEVIKTRINVLVENLSKWGAVNNIVTNNDPRDFARLQNYFDVMVVDAPCSGSGLFRRDEEAIKEWSPEAVQMCSNRQQRILTDSYAALKQNGILIYSTCSYSIEENEKICDWICEHFDVIPQRINLQSDWNIVETSAMRSAAPGYRFYPDRIKGEGFFIACFKKMDGQDFFDSYPKKNRFVKLLSGEREIVDPWLKDASSFNLYHLEEDVFAFPVDMDQDLAALHANLYTKKAGVRVGRLVKKELLPNHELAVSEIVNQNLLSVSLKKEDALQYLRKEEVKVESVERGWALVKYEGINLGWVKILGNRTNNYYPKEWRILKSKNG